MSNINQIGIGSGHGQKPGTLQEITYLSAFDTVLLPAATKLTKKELFGNSTKDSQYKNFTFVEDSRYSNIKITHMRAVTAINFTLGVVGDDGGSPANDIYETNESAQQRFEEYSVIEWDINNANYDPIALIELLPHKQSMKGSAVGSFSHTDSLFALPTPIDVPSDGNIRLFFNPASDMTTAAASTFIFPSAGFTNDLGFAIKFILYGTRQRKG